MIEVKGPDRRQEGGRDMNRIEAAFERMAKQIQGRIRDGKTTQEKVDATGKSLDMDLEEYVKFQELKSLAVAEGKLTLEEGQAIYACLGNIPATFNSQPVHVKAVLTGVFGELLTHRLFERHRLPGQHPGDLQQPAGPREGG